MHANEHVAHGVPYLLVSRLPARYAELLDSELPLEPDELDHFAAFLPSFEDLCAELASDGQPDTVQHDDLHMGSVYQLDGRPRVLDWGDSSISHPFFSLVVTFRFLEEHTGLRQDDQWFGRLRDAYLEAWGSGLRDAFELAVRVGRFAHAIAWQRHREFLRPPERTGFEKWFATSFAERSA